MAFKFLCPKCGKLVDRLSVVADETNEYKVGIDGFGETVWELDEVISSECAVVHHYDCDFETHEWRPDDFLVEIDDDGNIKPVGDYWSFFKEDFKRLTENLINNQKVNKA